MRLSDMIDFNEMLKLTEDQGHKIKGQGQVCKYDYYYIMYQWLNINDIDTNDYYRYFEVDLR